MAAATIDTLKYANLLKATGIPADQAEGHAAALAEALQINLKDLATKDDLARTAGELRAETREVEQRLSAKIDALGARLDAKFDAAVAKLDAKLDANIARIDGQFALHRWMLGASIALNLTVLVRLFMMAR